MEDRCNCQEYKRSMDQIISAQMLAWSHGIKYTGDTFIYCPCVVRN